MGKSTLKKVRQQQQQKRRHQKYSSAETVYRQIPVIELLRKTNQNSRLRKDVLQYSPESVNALSSIAKNILNGSVPLKSKKQRLIINKFRSQLMGLSSGSRKKKKEILQHGGFFGAAIAPLIPIAISLVSDLLNRS